jgi:hypothetical protein
MQPSIQWAPEAFPLRIKQLMHEADHPPTPIAKVKNVQSYTSTPQCLHDVVLN